MQEDNCRQDERVKRDDGKNKNSRKEGKLKDR